jgi:hypothetical protein
MASYGSLCDDFGVSAHLLTKLDLPTAREAVLHFFASVRKAYPEMLDFERRDGGEYALEEDREKGSYRWVSLEPRRLSTGYVNPPAVDDVDTQVDRIMEMAPYHLDLNPLDCEALDLVHSFDLVYSGNHDEVVAEALGLPSPLESLLQLPGSRVLNFEPSIMLALDEACRLQCRLSVETRTNAYQIRTGQYGDAAITVFFTVRQYWGRQPYTNFVDSLRNQTRIAREMIDSHVIPAVLRPLAQTIAAK